MKYKKNNKFIIHGGKQLHGEVFVQGSKNASLPIMSACLLSKEKIVLKHIPDIVDVHNMILILKKLGVKIIKRNGNLYINSQQANGEKLDCKLAKTMRSSLFLLGSMLSRFKTATITAPGGCKIGKRPIDIHIQALKKLNVKVFNDGELIHFDASKAKASKVKLRLASVGATENIIQFSSLLEGKTVIENPAKEPEVVDLANFLNSMGAKITGAGTNKITIYGVKSLYGTIYTPAGDRIATGTILIAVAFAGGKVEIKNSIPEQNEKLLQILVKMGCKIKIKNDIITISKTSSLKSVGEIATGYYPNFPTDLQSMMLALSCVASGKTCVSENIFENRFLTIPELEKMGANITKIHEKQVVVNGVKMLTGAKVKALDLRGGASLVLAGLYAKGVTEVSNAHFIDRGYDHLEDVLTKLGADIRRI